MFRSAYSSALSITFSFSHITMKYKTLQTTLPHSSDFVLHKNVILS